METNTVEYKTMNLEYASLGRRFLAALLDGLILCIPCAIANSLVPFVGGIVIWFFYAPILESSEIKATLGKHLMGIQVVDLSGRRISLRAATLRNLLKVVSVIIVFIGFFFALFTKKKQTLHDMLAETVVIYGRSERSVPDTWIEALKDLFNFNSDLSPNTQKSFTAETNESVISQLERLQSLRDRGTLTEEEFLKQKEKLLSSS